MYTSSHEKAEFHGFFLFQPNAKTHRLCFKYVLPKKNLFKCHSYTISASTPASVGKFAFSCLEDVFCAFVSMIAYFSRIKKPRLLHNGCNKNSGAIRKRDAPAGASGSLRLRMLFSVTRRNWLLKFVQAIKGVA